MNYQRFFLFNQFEQHFAFYFVSVNMSNTFSFKIKNIEYFNFNPNATQMIKMKNNFNIYYNIFSFTQRLRAIAVNEMASVVSKNLHFCLMGIADS